MNEYLTTALGEDHRRELLAEASSNSLARQAMAGRPSWWSRLSARTAKWASNHRRARHAHLQPVGPRS
jgi:hypothetical protein